MTTSGQQSPAPTPPTVPAGHVAISEAEHNRINAENRRLNKEAGDRAAADAAAASQAEREAAEARGAYDAALAAEQTARAASDARADAALANSALLQEVTRRGYSGEQAAALLTLTDGSQVTGEGAGADAAVGAALAKYPALFNTPAVPPVVPGALVVPGAVPPQVPPTLPPSSTSYGKGYETVDGFVTQEEYVRTPQAERLTEEFQARVRKSEPFWPAEVPATSFSQNT